MILSLHSTQARLNTFQGRCLAHMLSVFPIASLSDGSLIVPTVVDGSWLPEIPVCLSNVMSNSLCFYFEASHRVICVCCFPWSQLLLGQKSNEHHITM